MHHNYDDDMVNDGYDYLVTCYQCGNEFEAKRDDAAFCSPTCRSRNHRAKQKLDKDIAQAKSLIHDLIDRMPRMGESEVFTTLNELSFDIKRALSSVDR